MHVIQLGPVGYYPFNNIWIVPCIDVLHGPSVPVPSSPLSPNNIGMVL